jgi:Uma2 family endonuclease
MPHSQGQRQAPATPHDLVGPKGQEVRQEVRQEVIDGVSIPKEQGSRTHAAIHAQLVTQLDSLGGGWHLASSPEIELAAHQVYLPDLAGWRTSTMPTLPHERTVLVPPDWVCEILSPTTTERDLGPKHAHYCAAGVGHYWIIDPTYSTLLVLRNIGKAFVVAAAATCDDNKVALEPFPEHSLDLRALFAA